MKTRARTCSKVWIVLHDVGGCNINVIIDSGEVDWVYGCVVIFVVFLMYFQDNRIDIITTPSAHMESWRILLHLAASLRWDAQQVDVKTAFFYGLLPEEEVQYTEQPAGFKEPSKEDWVWKLERGQVDISGIRQWMTISSCGGAWDSHASHASTTEEQ